MRDWWILIPLILTQIALPFGLLIFLPGLSFLPVALLGLLILRRWRGLERWRRVLAISALVVWAAYAAYETRMYYWMLTVVAPIRVDLLLLIPVLWIATLTILLSCLARRPA